MCLLYFVPPRLIWSNIHQYTMIIFSFILLYLVLPRAISSKSVHPFLEARFGELRINLLGMKAQHHVVNYIVDIAPGQKREKHQTRKHDMQWQLMTCKIYQARCCKIYQAKCQKVGLISLIQGYAIGNQLSSAQGNQPKLKEFLAKKPVLKSVLRLRQLPWCQTLKISGYRNGNAVTCLWHKWCTHVLALVSIHITERGQISLLMVFSSMEIIRAHVKRTCREGWVWCRDSMIGNFWPLWYRYQAVVKDIDAWEPKARASWVKHHSWHFMTSCLWLHGLIISECSWLLTFQFVQICVVHSLVGSLWGEWQSWQSILPEINARWSRVAF